MTVRMYLYKNGEVSKSDYVLIDQNDLLRTSKHRWKRTPEGDVKMLANVTGLSNQLGRFIMEVNDRTLEVSQRVKDDVDFQKDNLLVKPVDYSKRVQKRKQTEFKFEKAKPKDETKKITIELPKELKGILTVTINLEDVE